LCGVITLPHATMKRSVLAFKQGRKDVNRGGVGRSIDVSDQKEASVRL